MMGDLPAHRLEPNRPFLISGVDYIGSILIREAAGREKKNSEGLHRHIYLLLD